MQALANSSAVARLPVSADVSGLRSLSTSKVSVKASAFTSNALAASAPAIKSKRSKGVVCMSAAAPVSEGYASALIEIAQTHNALEHINKDVEALASLLKNNEIKGYLSNPVIGDEKKKAILKTISDDSKFSQFTLNFLYLLVDKKRIVALPDICISFEALYCQATNTQVAEVVSAVKLENAQQALIAKKLQSLTGAKNIKLKNVVDSSLIAGFVLKYGADGSSFIDMSVKGQIDKLNAQFELSEAF